jgi:hypothetical protein
VCKTWLIHNTARASDHLIFKGLKFFFRFDAILALPGLLKKLLLISSSDPKHLIVSTYFETSRHKSERFLLCSIAYHNLTLEQQETFWTERPGKSFFFTLHGIYSRKPIYDYNTYDDISFYFRQKKFSPSSAMTTTKTYLPCSFILSACIPLTVQHMKKKIQQNYVNKYTSYFYDAFRTRYRTGWF